MADSRQADRDIGALIVAARHRASLSQKQLGKELGISEDHIGRFERGAQPVSASRLRKIAEVCGVRRDFFTQSFEQTPGEDLSEFARRIRQLEEWRRDEEERRRREA
jgi:transcriptional regulator with XRE-family HTH domain